MKNRHQNHLDIGNILKNEMQVNLESMDTRLESLSQLFEYCQQNDLDPTESNQLLTIISSIEAKLSNFKKLNTIAKHPADENNIQKMSSIETLAESKPNQKSHSNSTIQRKAIVNLMILSVQYWCRLTQLGKVELAQQSKQWTVYVNDGRLFTRTMNRYLSINTLPKCPRVNNVLNTGYFVLKRCRSDKNLDLSDLEESLANAQYLINERSLLN